jgi:hypothetical protein
MYRGTTSSTKFRPPPIRLSVAGDFSGTAPLRWIPLPPQFYNCYAHPAAATPRGNS